VIVPRIDPTARVADGAKVADDVEIGPFCIVSAQAELRTGVRLLSHVNIAGATVIGERTTVYPFASLGTPPQSVRYRGGATRLVVGSDCNIREGVTMNTGTEDGGGVTTVGDRCFFMVGSHVAHDCYVGNDVTFANNAVIAGHVSIGDHVFMGGQAAVHQFRRIGEGAMIGGLTGITLDMIPFGFSFGTRAELVGLNVIGLKRRKQNRADMHRLRHAYRALFFASGTLRDRVEKVDTEFGSDPLVKKILAFVRETKPGTLMTPAQKQTGSSVGDDSEP
jgi:UDP-N-acetylglucosamine acyltransferase